MTTPVFFSMLTSIVADLSRDLPVNQRYQRLLEAIRQLFPCDAAALLQLDDKHLTPLAIYGLSDDSMGRRFVVTEHPRLARLLASREPVRFAADSTLPDPYDGLVETADHQLHVHDCMGVSLYIDGRPWGVLTLDALRPGSFDDIDSQQLRTFISLTEATVKAAARMDALQAIALKEQQVSKALLDEGDSRTELIGESAIMRRLKEEIAIVAQSHLTVLVLGETGVGKELVARQVHYRSTRHDRPLVYVNCAALPETIAESELFGHIKGAFTGAGNDRAGKFEIADGGTLFLDEVGELPLSIQAKLLRALQSGEIQRVGSDRHIEVDTRIVAATNRDLTLEVNEGRFRADLYHRLSVYPVIVPPLRERERDILLLAGYLLEANQHRLGVRGLRLGEDARQILLSYRWPGNVRELEHLLSRAALRAISTQGRDQRTVTLNANHLGLDSADLATPTSAGLPAAAAAATELNKRPGELLSHDETLKSLTDQFQQRLINAALSANQNNQSATAKALGVDRSNLNRLLKRLAIKIE